MAGSLNEDCEEVPVHSSEPCDTVDSEVNGAAEITFDKAKSKQVGFNLYTRTNRSYFKAQMATCGSEEEVDGLACSPAKKTFFLVHGWLGGKYSLMSLWMPSIKQALLDKFDCNVFIVNWGIEKTHFRGFLRSKAANQARKVVGPVLATFIRQLEKQKNMDRTNMHIIGHSLGGLAAAAAGKSLFDEDNRKVARITGLDTPDYVKEDKTVYALQRDDAEFVDEIHTLYSKSRKGHADFFPNGGNGSKIFQAHRHMYAPTYFIRSIKDGDLSYACEPVAEDGTEGVDAPETNHMGFYATKPSKPSMYILQASTFRGYTKEEGQIHRAERDAAKEEGQIHRAERDAAKEAQQNKE